MDARKTKIGAREALDLLRQVDEIFAAKGKSVVHFDLKKQKPNDDELLQVLIGPTGNLRAPTFRKGMTLIVGFDRETYEKFFK